MLWEGARGNKANGNIRRPSLDPPMRRQAGHNTTFVPLCCVAFRCVLVCSETVHAFYIRTPGPLRAPSSEGEEGPVSQRSVHHDIIHFPYMPIPSILRASIYLQTPTLPHCSVLTAQVPSVQSKIKTKLSYQSSRDPRVPKRTLAYATYVCNLCSSDVMSE